MASCLLAAVAVQGGPSAELAVVEAGVLPAALEVMQTALAWGRWLEPVCKPILHMLSTIARSGAVSC